MIEPYEELLEGEMCLRLPPSDRHEEICRRLHERVTPIMAGLSAAQLLPARTLIKLTRHAQVRPDLALVTVPAEKLWLAAEVISSDDHNVDTVTKKTIYEEMNLPRLWIVDPRYNNVEVYHGGPHGLTLKHILSLRETLSEPLLPGFQYNLADLFKL